MRLKRNPVNLNRRQFAKALGFGVGAPLLTPFFASAASGAQPKRFVIVLEGNGVNPGNFLSEATRQALVARGADIPSNMPLINRKYRHDSVVEVNSASLADAPSLGSLAGGSGLPSLEEHSRVVLGLSSKASGAGHTTNYGALSCAPSGIGKPSAPTIDHVLAGLSQVQGNTPYSAFRVGIHPEAKFNYNTCAAGPNAPLPIVCDTRSAYSALFGSVAPGIEGQKFLNQKKLLDFIHQDVTVALSKFSGNSIERAKLEPDGPDVSPLYDSDHQLEKLDVMFDLSSAALIGGLTNMVVIASGTGERGFNINYTDIGLKLEDSGRHGICHGLEYDVLTTITERHVSLVSRMARKLMAVPEGSGTMLDNTLILYGSDNGEKHHSLSEEWPLLAVGGSSLGLGTGNKSVVYPGYGNNNNRQLSNMYNTLGYLAGSPIDAFGTDSSRVATGPLSELLA